MIRSYAFLSAYGPDVSVAGQVADDRGADSAVAAHPRRARADRSRRGRGSAGTRRRRRAAVRGRAAASGRLRSSVSDSFDRFSHTKWLAMPLHAGVVAAREVAAVRPLDLDDARAEIGELPRGERPGDGLFDRDDGDALQWRRLHHALRCPTSSGGRGRRTSRDRRRARVSAAHAAAGRRLRSTSEWRSRRTSWRAPPRSAVPGTRARRRRTATTRGRRAGAR